MSFIGNNTKSYVSDFVEEYFTDARRNYFSVLKNQQENKEFIKEYSKYPRYDGVKLYKHACEMLNIINTGVIPLKLENGYDYVVATENDLENAEKTFTLFLGLIEDIEMIKEKELYLDNLAKQ